MLRMRGSSQGGCSLQEKKRRQRKHVTARLCGALRGSAGRLGAGVWSSLWHRQNLMCG